MVTNNQSLIQRFRNVFTAKAKPVDSYKEILDDQRRSQLYPQGTYQILDLPYDYSLLYELATKDSLELRTVHEAIIKECVRNKGIVKPRWMRKCPKCGTEFKTDKEKCPDCKVETDKPSIEQKQILDAFIEQPNKSDEIGAIQISSYRYMLSCSDWYISIQKNKPTALTPFAIYVEDATKIRICVDSHDNLGNDEYFCPSCTKLYPEEYYPAGASCRHCGNIELKQTAYIYKDGTVQGRWAADEMLHGCLDPDLPRRYGVARTITALRLLFSLAAMDQFNLDTYTDGKLAKILAFVGVPQDKVNDIMQAAKSQQNKPEYDAKLGRWITRKLNTLGLGVEKDLKSIDAMPDPEKMQSSIWWNLWKEALCAVYNVQDVAAGQSQPGTTGQNPRMKLDINNNTTEYYQHQWTDPFNNVVVQALGVTDWIYDFNPVEEKDEAQDMAILQSKLTVIQTAINLGMDAELTDEQEVKISGKPETLEEKQKRAMETMQKQAELAPKDAEQKDTAFNGKEPIKKENVFATEKGSKQWIVIEQPTHKEH